MDQGYQGVRHALLSHQHPSTHHVRLRRSPDPTSCALAPKVFSLLEMMFGQQLNSEELAMPRSQEVLVKRGSPERPLSWVGYVP